MKNVIFCADGTWDGPENGPDAYPSNVLKLFNALDGELLQGELATSLEQERRTGPANQPTQIAKYIHGVGDSSNFLQKVMGGSLGTGLIARLLRGYTFISRNFEPGDRIFLVGFSRGAYTARALGDFICKMGLLNWAGLGLDPQRTDLRGYQYAAAAWLDYQKARRKAAPHRFWLGGLESYEADLAILLPALLRKPEYVPVAEIAAIAVWDTVGALGIPQLSADHGVRIDLLRFVNTELDRVVKRGFHAIAADEQRIDFSPTLWTPDERITQCFFPGAHADVGGGYPLGPESLLSDGALEWMMDNLRGCGVSFASPFKAPVEYELGPMHMPWTSAGFELRPTGPREFPPFVKAPPRLTVHPAIGRRLAKPVLEFAATTPPISRKLPYLPVALVSAGYLDISKVAVFP